jgi:hypothetical protein
MLCLPGVSVSARNPRFVIAHIHLDRKCPRGSISPQPPSDFVVSAWPSALMEGQP